MINFVLRLLYTVNKKLTYYKDENLLFLSSLSNKIIYSESKKEYKSVARINYKKSKINKFDNLSNTV